MTEAEAQQLFERLRRAHLLYEQQQELLRQRAAADPEGLSMAASLTRDSPVDAALQQVYGAPTVEAAFDLYFTDRALLEEVLRSAALQLGESELATMRSIRRAVWWRYLDAGHNGERAPQIDGEVTSFARALAAWLVFTSQAPYPAFPEELPIWQDTPLGMPPTPPPTPLPGGTQPPDLDAGVPAAPGQEVGPARVLPWHRWGAGDNDGRRFARYSYPQPDYPQPDGDARLQHRLVAPEQGGHPLLALVKEFATPSEVYDLLTSDESRRTAGVRALIRRIDRLLAQGLHKYEQGVGGRERDTMHELFEAAKWALFPEGPPRRRDQPLHRLADLFMPATRREVVANVTSGVSLILTLATLGTAAPALGAVMVAIDIGAAALDVAFAIEQDERARQHKRFEAIDRTLRRAEATENITALVAFHLLLILAPPALDRLLRGAVASAGSGLLRRALARLARSGRRARPAQPPELTGAAAARQSRMTGAGAQASRQAERAVAGRATRAAPHDPRAPDPRAIQSRAVEARARGTVPPRTRGTTDSGLDDELDNAFREWPTETPPAGPTAAADEGLEIAGFLINREQQFTLGRLLDRLMGEAEPRAVVSARDAAHRAALEAAEQRAADLLRRIRAHWDAALPRGWQSVERVADRVFQRLLQTHPSNPNQWVRKTLFNLWRRRAMRRIGNDKALVRDLANQAGLVVARNPQTRTASFRLPARAADGRPVHVGLDVDHGAIRHEDAIRRALDSNDSSHLTSTVDSAGLQLMPRENRIVIERLRADTGRWVGPTSFRPGEPFPPAPPPTGAGPAAGGQ